MEANYSVYMVTFTSVSLTNSALTERSLIATWISKYIYNQCPYCQLALVVDLFVLSCPHHYQLELESIGAGADKPMWLLQSHLSWEWIPILPFPTAGGWVCLSIFFSWCVTFNFTKVPKTALRPVTMLSWLLFHILYLLQSLFQTRHPEGFWSAAWTKMDQRVSTNQCPSCRRAS